jgi:hypothetical protein
VTLLFLPGSHVVRIFRVPDFEKKDPDPEDDVKNGAHDPVVDRVSSFFEF